ncbi:MAG TPA: APC family permease [Anaerolineaceae bacterium]|nr:APC family permease [Anaerolineaceae bacterium]
MNLREMLFGSPLPTLELSEKKLNKVRALAAFSPDALSSIAYANQEIYLGLVVAGAAGLSWAFPIGLAIVGLLAIVALSYAQTIQGYPSGGGSYVVARENLGPRIGLVAAAALLIDYILTAAVSLTAGVDAIASAFPFVHAYRIELALAILVVMTLANLRGLRDTGTLMSIPVYLFLATYLPMLALGLYRLATSGPVPLEAAAPVPVQPLTLVLVLHAFAAGCTALTGVEAISNGVPAFKPSERSNARITLGVMTVLMGILFAGSIGLTQSLGVIAQPNETILSALSRTIFDQSIGYYLVQVTTLLILAVAANTSFAGFPRIAAILAADKYLPRQLTNLGDRLVYANGIVLLSVGTALLILAFGGDTHSLVPLFAVGAFLAYTISQTGMVVHWLRLRGPGWLVKAAINGLGAVVTGAALLIIGYSKFLLGAWISILLIPLFIFVFRQIHRHYIEVAQQLSLHGLPPSLKPLPPPRVVIPIAGVHRGVIDAINFARSMTDQITAVFIELDPGSAEEVCRKWCNWLPDIPIVVVQSPYRSIVSPLLDYLDKTDLEHNDGQQAVLLMPEFIPAHWWEGVLHNQSAWLIKAALLYRKRQTGYQRVMIDIPYHLRE